MTDWPPAAVPDSIVIMGKTHAPGVGTVELEARASLAATVWGRLGPGPIVICVEGHDLPDTTQSGAEVAEACLRGAGVPAAAIVARGISNCTVREVAAIGTILRDRGRTRPLVITHGYHAARAARYFREAGIVVQMLACSVAAFDRWRGAGADVGALRAAVARGEPNRWNRGRERVVEVILSVLHTGDRAGRVECWLADRVRRGGRVRTQPATPDRHTL